MEHIEIKCIAVCQYAGIFQNTCSNERLDKLRNYFNATYFTGMTTKEALRQLSKRKKK
jgi:hypothetical protein